MSMAAALKAEHAVALARDVVAIELLCACQALDLLDRSRRPRRWRACTRWCGRASRRSTTDRPPSRDIHEISRLIESGDIERACAMKVN